MNLHLRNLYPFLLITCQGFFSLYTFSKITKNFFLFEFVPRNDTIYQSLQTFIFHQNIMIQNIFLFTWQEKYLLDKELFRRKEGFIQKFWSDSVFIFTLDNLQISHLKQAIYSSWLFTTKKLILVYWLPLDATTKLDDQNAEQLQTFIDALIKAEGKIPDDSLLVFISPVPDKRLRLFKFLEKHATVKEFNQPKDNDLEEFIRKELSDYLIDRQGIQYLLAKVWRDLYRLRFECDKLKTRCRIKNLKTIDTHMIDHVVYGQVETDSFSLLKAIFSDKRQAISILEKIHTWWADQNQFAGMLYRAMKFYLFMIDLDNDGVKDPKEIALFLKMNPRQVKNEHARIWLLKANKKNIEIFYTWLIELDAGIKSWKYPDTYFRLGIKKLINALA